MASAIDQAKSVSIYDVIQSYCPEFVRPRHSSVNSSCPFHEDKTPSFHIYDKTNSFHCFSCGASGTGIDFVMRVTGLCDPLAAAEDLCDMFHLTYTKEPVAPENKLYYDVYAYVESLFVLANTRYVFPDGRVPNDYWVDRKLEAVVKDYGLGYCPPVWLDKERRVIPFAELLKAKFPKADLLKFGLANSRGECVVADRYIFPIRDARGRTVGFTGRARDAGNPAKYKNTPETDFFKKRELLYNWDKAKGFDSVFIVEGPCDALSLASCGVKNVVGCLGSSITSSHLILLQGVKKVLALDNDKVGREKTSKMVLNNPDLLLHSLKPYTLGSFKDFNDVLLAGINLADVVSRKNIIYGVEFVLLYLTSTLDLTHTPDREFIYATIKNLLESGLYSDVLKDTVAIRTKRVLGVKDRIL